MSLKITKQLSISPAQIKQWIIERYLSKHPETDAASIKVQFEAVMISSDYYDSGPGQPTFSGVVITVETEEDTEF